MFRQVSLGVVELLKPGPDTSLGALVLICSPAEGTSNLLILLAEADLTLSVTITCVTNFAAIGKFSRTELPRIFLLQKSFHNPSPTPTISDFPPLVPIEYDTVRLVFNHSCMNIMVPKCVLIKKAT